MLDIKHIINLLCVSETNIITGTNIKLKSRSLKKKLVKELVFHGSACAHEEYIYKLLKCLHRNLVSNIESYKVGAYYLFPTYHGCQHRNRNGTRKKIQYNKGEQCINPVHTACWRKTKKKYLSPKVYNTTY